MTASTIAVASDLPPAPRAEHGPPDGEAGPSGGSALVGRLLTGLIVIGPAVVLAVGVPLLWGRLINLHDVIIAAALYLVTGLGIALGYHRLFAHRSFRANRTLKIVLAAAGSMAVEGSVIGWTATHRRHHRFTDRPGDPHSPHVPQPHSGRAHLRGLAHAHAGWLFKADTTAQERYVPDLLADRDLVVMGHLWGVFAIGALVLPFLLGWIITGTLLGGLSTFLWAGVARMLLLHHVTWSVNSLCHSYGRRPFRTKDQSTNLALLSLLSFGDSFHNFHHAYPTSARHGVLPHQPDPAAAAIRCFERAGWATDVQWPDPTRVARLQRDPNSRQPGGTDSTRGR